MLVGAATDVGVIRSMNQDYYYCSEKNTGIHFYIIADGMGGHKGGEVASCTSVNVVKDYIVEHYWQGKYQNNRLLLVRDAFLKSNQEVFEMSEKKEELRGMGTTLTMALVEDNVLYMGHIGDSRIYLIKDGKAEKITEDHSLVEELVKNGSISQEEADNHPQKNIITRALGTQLDVEIDVVSRKLEKVDMLLMCTDGLTNMLNEKDIELIYQKIKDPQKLCNSLITEANKRGGKDNITVIAVKVRCKR